MPSSVGKDPLGNGAERLIRMSPNVSPRNVSNYNNNKQTWFSHVVSVRRLTNNTTNKTRKQLTAPTANNYNNKQEQTGATTAVARTGNKQHNNQQ